MFGLSAGELIVVTLIVTLVFGWSWFPRIGERVGALMSGVKQGMREDDERIVVKQGKKDEPKRPSPPASPEARGGRGSPDGDEEP